MGSHPVGRLPRVQSAALHNGTKCRGQPGGPRGKSHMLATARSTVPLTWVPTSAHANPSWFAPGPLPLKAACSPQQGLPAKADKPIVVRAGLPFQNSGAVPPPEAEPSRVTGATSGGATLLGAIPRPDTRLTTRPTQTSSLPGLVPYSPKERVPLPGDKPPIGKGGRPG
jgi:hypothetical protein